MTYVPGYDFDVFISYAHVDNEAIKPADYGWVDALHHALRANLDQKIGRKEAHSIWRDGQDLRGNHEVSYHIPDQVKHSALFLAVLSPGYLASTFCLEELEAFVNHVRAVNNIEKGTAQRLFVVYRYPLVDESRQPEVFRDLAKYQFWTRDWKGKPHTFGSPLPLYDDAEDRKYYYPAIGDLAEGIVLRLNELKEATNGAAPRPPAEVRQKKPTELVLLAQVTDDLHPRRQEMRRYLDQADVGTLPAGTYRQTRTEFEQSFSADLDKCKAFVQLLGLPSGITPPDVPEGFARLQFDLAKSRHVPVLQWRSPDLNVAEISSAAHRQLLQAETVQAVPFEEFKRAIVDTVTRKEQPKSERASYIFVNAAQVDMNRAQALIEDLGDSFDCVRPLYESDAKAEQIQNEIENGLIDCDALVVLYGEVGGSWVGGQLQQYRKIVPKRAKDPRLLAVAMASKEAKTSIPIWLKGMTTFPIDEAAARIRAAFAA